MVNLITYVLVAVFGSSSWLSTNSVWMELSLMVDTLPEGWSLPSYLTAIIQIACVAPLIYSVLHKCTNFYIPKASIILILLVYCSVCTLLMAFMWDTTGFVFGKMHSVLLIVLMFMMALVNTTSDVLFLPYMTTFHSTYLTAYFVGMGFSALIPSLFSLIQGTGSYDCVYNATTGTTTPEYHSARFGVRDFNFIMFGWMITATVAFALLHWKRDNWIKSDSTFNHKEIETIDSETTDNEEINQNFSELQNEGSSQSSFTRYCILLGCLSWICAQMNGVIPSILSYSTLSYTPLTYHLALTLGNLAQALACFLPLWIQPRSTWTLITLTAVATAFCAYIFVIALQSPTPLLAHSNWGGILSVAASVLAAGFQAYLRGVITSVVREDNLDSDSRLFWCGLFMQIGSFFGACVMFPLVNYANIFESAIPCGNY